MQGAREIDMRDEQDEDKDVARIGQLSRASRMGIGRWDGPACKCDDVSEG
jgi:hypothetical protein